MSANAILGNSARPLILAHQTLLKETPPRLVQIAAEAGYDGVTLRAKRAHPDQVQFPMLGDTAMMRETQKALRDSNLFVQDIEIIRLNPTSVADDYLPVLEAGARVGARFAGALCDDPDENRFVDNLCALAERAAPLGQRLYFEFMIYTEAKNIDQAIRIVGKTGRDDIALIVDPLHLDRSGGDPQDIRRIDPKLLPYAQLCDADRKGIATDMAAAKDEARSHRKLPGEGTLPLFRFLNELPPGVPLVLEVPCAELEARTTSAAFASLLLDASRKLVLQADSQRQLEEVR